MEAVLGSARPHASTENDVQTPILCRPGGTAFILPYLDLAISDVGDECPTIDGFVYRIGSGQSERPAVNPREIAASRVTTIA